MRLHSELIQCAHSVIWCLMCGVSLSAGSNLGMITRIPANLQITQEVCVPSSNGMTADEYYSPGELEDGVRSAEFPTRLTVNVSSYLVVNSSSPTLNFTLHLLVEDQILSYSISDPITPCFF